MRDKVANDPSEWHTGEVLLELKGAGEIGLDGATFVRLTPEDFETDELCLEPADQQRVLQVVEKLKACSAPVTNKDMVHVKDWVMTAVCVDAQGNSFFGERRIPLKGSSEGNCIGMLSDLIGAKGLIFRETPHDYAFDWCHVPERTRSSLTGREAIMTESCSKFFFFTRIWSSIHIPTDRMVTVVTCVTFHRHVAPAKQYILNLDAAVEVEVSDGSKKIIEAGSAFYVEDTFGKGHISRSVGNKVRRSVFILVDDEH